MSKNNELAEIVNAQSQQLTQSTSVVINDTYDALVVNQTRNILPEAVFVEYFLDFFMHPSANHESTLLSKWIEVAGGVYNGVDIVDANANILFTAPAAMMPLTMNYANLNNFNFSAVASMYHMKKSRMAVQGTNYLNGILSSVDTNIQSDVRAYIMQWVAIFDRYSAKPVTDDLAKPQPNPQLGIDLNIF